MELAFEVRFKLDLSLEHGWCFWIGNGVALRVGFLKFNM